MQRTPPGDDEQDELAEYEQEAGETEETQEIEGAEEELEAYEGYYSARISRVPRVPHRQPGMVGRRSLEYGEDAFPHRPKVLRASRLLAPQELQGRERRAGTAPAEAEFERTTRRLESTTGRLEGTTEQRVRNSPAIHPRARQAGQRSQRRPYQAPRVEETEEDVETEEPFYTPSPRPARPARPQARPTQRLMVIPPAQARRRPAGHASPPPFAHPARRRREALSPLAYFQEWPYRKPALIIMSVIVALLILVPVLASVISSVHRPGVVINGTPTGTRQGQGQGTSAPPTNPHELVIIPSDTDHPPPPVFATSAYLLDADTGVTLYAHNPFMHLPMLSTTKLMTAIIAVQKGNPDQQITITPAIEHDIQQLSADSSIFGIKQGETYSLRDLLYGLFLVSGNDAAVAIADAIDGSQARFVAEMNQRAQQLGLYDTHYANPHGLLNAQQYSSAHDLAILARYALNIPLIHQISGTEQYHIPKTATHQEHFLFNENQFMWWYPGVDGGKTGYDGASDFVQVVSVTRNHHHLIGVVMHTNDWWTDMRDLMNWGFNTFTWVSPYIVDFQHPIPYDTLWDFFVKDKQQNTVPTADGGRYYIYSGYSISGPIMKYFDASGGLKIFGYPTAIPQIPNAQTIKQQFQHGAIQCNLTTKQCQTV